MKSIIRRYITRRGIAPTMIDDYLNPVLDPGRFPLPDADKAAARLLQAIETGERVAIFGDYDCDGIASVSILLRFFKECTTLRPIWKLPNRKTDQYGLDIVMAEKLVTEFHPGLVICVDCGTNSAEAVTWLRQRGVDTVVVDHHPVTTMANDAVAIVNPKAHPSANSGDLIDLCAAGLSLLLCNYFAEQWRCANNWNHVAATMLSGIATLADSVPMGSTNRAIVKSALFLLNTPSALGRCTGLRALVPADGQRISQRRIEFGIVPPLNALGRLGDASLGVTLLTIDDEAEAQKIAERCRELNEQRKALQLTTVEQALKQAHELLSRMPGLPVLVLAHPDWLPGVVGPAASRVADQLGRSAVLLGMDTEPQCWKGSGRAHHNHNLGAWLESAKRFGMVQRGGGHAGAVGVAVLSDQITKLRSMAQQQPMPLVEDHEPKYEAIGELGELRPEEWQQVGEALEPFGAGNPAPLIAMQKAKLVKEPVELRLKDSGQVWAVKGDFKSGKQTISVVWRNIDKTKELWQLGRQFDFELELSAKEYNGKLYFNWTVVNCQPAA